MAVRRRGEASVLAELYQSGCLKARFPRGASPGWFEIVTMNLSGGVVAGDRMRSAIEIGEGARASIAGQAAERFYRALPGGRAASVRTGISVAAGGTAEWLPQHSILFDGCALDRELRVDLAADASFLGVESLVFGRAAMGEEVANGWLRDIIRIRRDGHLLLHDAARLEGPIAAQLARPAVAGGARAMATLIYVAPEAEAALDRVRTALTFLAVLGSHKVVMPGRSWSKVPAAQADGSDQRKVDPGIHAFAADEKVVDGRTKSGHDDSGMPWEAGVSARDGMLLARILAPDGAALRAAVVAGLQAIHGGRMLPRVWLC